MTTSLFRSLVSYSKKQKKRGGDLQNKEFISNKIFLKTKGVHTMKTSQSGLKLAEIII